MPEDSVNRGTRRIPARIAFRELAEVLPALANIARFDLSPSEVATPDDLFLCSLGFEPRCLALPERLVGAGYRASRTAYFKYSTNPEDNDVNLGGMQDCLAKMGKTTQVIDADGDDFVDGFQRLLELTISDAAATPPRVTFDISVTANRLLLRCLRHLLNYDIRLRIVYSEAAVYHPTKEEYRTGKWKTDDAVGPERGVSQVMASVDYPGHDFDPLPHLVAIFPSFKRDRSRAVLNFVDPRLHTHPAGQVVWLLGKPHLRENGWRVLAMKKINQVVRASPQYELSTFNYKDTVRILEGLYLKWSETHTITLSPLGSKMQALGIALFCYMHPDVRIVFSIPMEYNAAQYSEGCRAVWCVDFGSLNELRCELDKVGTMRIVE